MAEPDNLCTCCLIIWFVWIPKGILSAVLGIITGVLPALIFASAISAITIIRLPGNIYSTLKVALTTVLFKPGLRILILFTLPVIHVLCPVIIIIAVSVASPIGFIFGMTSLIFEGECKHCDEPWKIGWKLAKAYWNKQDEFYKEVMQYHHETGIPLNWNGRRYGIPFGPIKCVKGVFFLFYGLVICGFGMCLLLTAKVIPGYFRILKWYLAYLFEDIGVIIFFPLYLMGLIFITAGYFTLFVLGVVGGFLASVYCPFSYVKYDNYKVGFQSAFKILNELDEATKAASCNVLLYPCLSNCTFDWNNEETSTEANEATQNATANFKDQTWYWNYFAEKCGFECTALVEKSWLNPDYVEALDPSAILAVPAITALKILTFSVENTKEKSDKSAIFWNEEVICSAKTKPNNDNIIDFLWPKIISIKKFLTDHQKELLQEQNLELVIADICNGQETAPIHLETYLQDKKMGEHQRKLKQMLLELSLCLSRMGPMVDRMHTMLRTDERIRMSPSPKANETCV